MLLEKNPIEMGTVYTVQKRVVFEDTSLNYGSGKVENLFATPRLVALALEAGSQLVDPHLPEDFVSVCRHVEVDHFKATCMGATVTVKAEVTLAEGDTIELDITAYDEHGLIGKGKHTRKIVHHKHLLERAMIRDMSLNNEE